MSESAALPYVVRPMRVEDLDDVMAIERASYSTPWPVSAFQYDLTQNKYANYLVATLRRPATDGHAPAGWWQRLLRGDGDRPQSVLGYGGFWSLVDEAHISNIAVMPAWRGRGIGELVLISMIERATELGMRITTLEVRVTNTVAQNLYRKYGFDVVGRRRGYYSDNNEDAYIMSTGLIGSAEYQERLRSLQAALMARLEAQERAAMGEAEERQGAGEIAAEE